MTNDELETAALKLGSEHGYNAATWATDGNTSQETYKSILQGYEDGDPEVMDMQPSPLSGEWADDPTPNSVLEAFGVEDLEGSEDGRWDWLLDAYEGAFSEAYWDELIGTCRAQLMNQEEE